MENHPQTTLKKFDSLPKIGKAEVKFDVATGMNCPRKGAHVRQSLQDKSQTISYSPSGNYQSNS